MDSFFFGLFGLIVGSFLNVLILRHGKQLSGRSTCPHCKKSIRAIDLVPVISWLLLRGRCRDCGGRISIQYPLVEALTALIFFGIGAAPLPLVARIVALPIAALLLAIAVYDLYHAIIPDAWVYPFAGLALFASVSLTPSPVYSEIILAGFLSAAPLYCLWFFSGGRYMGLGDAKLALGMGWLLGPTSGIVSVVFAFMLGALVGVALLFFSSAVWEHLLKGFTPTNASRKAPLGFTMKSEIPFGPFLIASCFLIWFTHLYGLSLPFGVFAFL